MRMLAEAPRTTAYERDPERIDRMLDKVREHWRRFPDLRLTQLIYVCLGNPQGDVYGVEDDVLERALDTVLG